MLCPPALARNVQVPEFTMGILREGRIGAGMAEA